MKGNSSSIYGGLASIALLTIYFGVLTWPTLIGMLLNNLLKCGTGFWL